MFYILQHVQSLTVWTRCLTIRPSSVLIHAPSGSSATEPALLFVFGSDGPDHTRCASALHHKLVICPHGSGLYCVNVPRQSRENNLTCRHLSYLPHLLVVVMPEVQFVLGARQPGLPRVHIIWIYRTHTVCYYGQTAVHHTQRERLYLAAGSLTPRPAGIRPPPSRSGTRSEG